MSLIEVVKVGLLAELAIAMPLASVWIARQVIRHVCQYIDRRIDEAERRITGHVKAAGIASAALDDEFGPTPPAVPAGVQAGQHRELYAVGSKRPRVRRVMAMAYRLVASACLLSAPGREKQGQRVTVVLVDEPPAAVAG